MFRFAVVVKLYILFRGFFKKKEKKRKEKKEGKAETQGPGGSRNKMEWRRDGLCRSVWLSARKDVYVDRVMVVVVVCLFVCLFEKNKLTSFLSLSICYTRLQRLRAMTHSASSSYISCS